MNYDLKEIFSQFRHRGSFKRGFSYGNGHINDTFLIESKISGEPDHILQRINSKIFKNPPALMANIELVTSHLRKRLPSGENSEQRVLTLITTNKGMVYYQDEWDNYWRLYLFIGPNHSYDIVPSPEIAFQGGKAFGRFQKLLTDLPGEKLSETIPRFHDINMRLNAFEEAVLKNYSLRAGEVKKEIEFVRSRKEIMSTIMNLGKEGKIPLRVTHNDTKFNNVLLDEQDNELCVIDLDTVMPGYIHYDFGDTIRTATNRGAEDEKDLSKVFCDRKIFTGFARGFLSQTASILTPGEKETLYLAGKTMTFIIGLRFITDYLQGDTYFKIHREHQNLDRCRCQFKLVESLEEQEEDLKEILTALMG